jgi:hypothetical protein
MHVHAVRLKAADSNATGGCVLQGRQQCVARKAPGMAPVVLPPGRPAYLQTVQRGVGETLSQPGSSVNSL